MYGYGQDVFVIKGVPKEFRHLGRKGFGKLLTEMALGDRLRVMASWPERIYVAEFLPHLDQRFNLLREQLPPDSARQPLSSRQRYVLLSLVRWFGTNCGRSFVEAVTKERPGQFFSTWDGQAFWYPGVVRTIKEYSLEQLIDRDPGTFPPHSRQEPFPRVTHADRELVTYFVRWLSDGAGAAYMAAVAGRIDRERARIEEARRKEQKRQEIERQLATERKHLYQEAGLAPA